MAKLNFVAVLQNHPEQFFDLETDRRGRFPHSTDFQRAAEDAVRKAGITCPRKTPTSVAVRIQQLTIKNGKVERSPGTTYTVQPPLERLSEPEYSEEIAEILADVPPDFHEFIQQYAYEHGHAYGMEECLGIAKGLVSDLLPAIKAFAKRLKDKTPA